MLAGYLLSSSPYLCELCAQCSSGLGSHWLPFSAFPCHPSWTCGGQRSPIHCSVVKSERPRGCSSPGSCQWLPCHPSWGWLWKNPCGCCCLCHSWVCHLEPQWPSWRETRGTPFCGCAVPKKRQMPVSGIVHIRSSCCNARLLCDSNRRGRSPTHRHRRTALLTCPTGRITTTTGMWRCEAL